MGQGVTNVVSEAVPKVMADADADVTDVIMLGVRGGQVAMVMVVVVMVVVMVVRCVEVHVVMVEAVDAELRRVRGKGVVGDVVVVKVFHVRMHILRGRRGVIEIQIGYRECLIIGEVRGLRISADNWTCR